MEPMPAQQFREALADLGRVTNPGRTRGHTRFSLSLVTFLLFPLLAVCEE